MNIDWLEIWNSVSIATRHTSEPEKVKRGKKHFRKDSKPRPDPLLDYALEELDSNQTLLDIGAGNGRWVLPAARKAQAVTAVEPSQSMLEMLRENIASAGLNNITIVRSRWEDTEVEPHDIVTCAHGIYETTDFAGFVRKMERHARHRVYLELRLPPHDGIINELFRKIYGTPFDSPNAIIAWNALYGMGIYPNLLVEDDMHHWEDATFEDAFARAKKHLNLEISDHYDELIRETLKDRLTFSGNTCIWPDGMRSALLWWDTGRQ